MNTVMTQPDAQAKPLTESAALAEAQVALGQLGLPDALPALHAAGLSISRGVLGGSHSVAVYPPIDALMPIAPRQVLDRIGFGADTSLYVHLPFCETRCTFCHYTVRHYAGKARASSELEREVGRYLAALKRELAWWGARLAQSGTAVSSVYIGGGTPLVLDQAVLGELIATIGSCFAIQPGAEVCIEGSPLTIAAPDGADKLHFLKQQGVTRLSFGVQSFDDAVLKYAGRAYKSELAMNAARIAGAIFENWNLDLIQGLYKGSPAETWHNLQVIAQLQPAHLTWYHGRFAERPQGDWYLSPQRHDQFEDEIATLLGRMVIWRGMAALGYQQCDGNRFVRARDYADPFKQIRTSAACDLLGVGVASYSHVSAGAVAQGVHGYQFRNDTRIGEYTDRVLSGDVPIATGCAIDDGELLAMSYATGLRRGRVEHAALRELAAGQPQSAAHYRALADRLRGLGVLEAYGEAGSGLRMTQLGRLFEDEILALFFSPAVQRKLTSRGDTPVALVRGAASPAAAFQVPPELVAVAAQAGVSPR